LSERQEEPSHSERTGVLLLNVGTPDSTETRDVRRYLGEFLSDPRVIDINPVLRWLLLHLVILRLRPKRSAEAYEKIWLPEGSPILVHGRAFEEALGRELGPAYDVVLAMRYGRPSIAEGVARLARREAVSRLVIFPLFPQLASATTGTALAAARAHLDEITWSPQVAAVQPFFNDEGYLQALAESARPTLTDLRPDHLLVSFHGLPERHVLRADPTGRRCLASEGCCAPMVPENASCYRAQCFETARLAASRLGLEEGAWTVSFQSRMGRTPWIGPHTTELVRSLAEDGVRRLAVLCPSFVTDCLETLEEIGERERESFKERGGEELLLVPSLNADAAWVKAAAGLVRGAEA